MKELCNTCGGTITEIHPESLTPPDAPDGAAIIWNHYGCANGTTLMDTSKDQWMGWMRYE